MTAQRRRRAHRGGADEPSGVRHVIVPWWSHTLTFVEVAVALLFASVTSGR